MPRLNAKWDDFEGRGQAWDSWWMDGPAAEAKEATGGGTLALTAALTGDGRKASSGGATLAVSELLVGSGRKSVASGGSLAASAILTGTGRKAVAGGNPASATVVTLQDGGPTQNEIQQITVVASGGTWTLTQDGFPIRVNFPSSDIPFDVPAASLEAPISNFWPGDVTVIESGGVYTVTAGAFGAMSQMVADGSDLVGVPLALSPTLSGDGSKGALGGASLDLAAVLAGDGTAAAAGDDRAGGGTLALVVESDGAGTKAVAGSGSLVVHPAFAGSGTATGAVAIEPAPIVLFGTARPARPQKHAHGGGRLVLVATFRGNGRKTYESDDELVMALAA